VYALGYVMLPVFALKIVPEIIRDISEPYKHTNFLTFIVQTLGWRSSRGFSVYFFSGVIVKISDVFLDELS